MFFEEKIGYVYVLTNTSYDLDLLKIGMTTRTPEQRAKELSTTGVPGIFSVAYSRMVYNCQTTERIVHHVLLDYKHNKEFFKLPLEIAIQAIDCIVDNPRQDLNQLKEQIKAQVLKDYYDNNDYYDSEYHTLSFRIDELLEKSNIPCLHPPLKLLKDITLLQWTSTEEKEEKLFRITQLFIDFLALEITINESSKYSDTDTYYVYQGERRYTPEVHKIIVRLIGKFLQKRNNSQDNILSQAICEVFRNENQDDNINLLLSLCCESNIWSYLEKSPELEFSLITLTNSKSNIIRILSAMALLHIENIVGKSFKEKDYDNILVNTIFCLYDNLSTYERHILLHNGPKFVLLLSSISQIYRRDIDFLTLYREALFQNMVLSQDEKENFSNKLGSLQAIYQEYMKLFSPSNEGISEKLKELLKAEGSKELLLVVIYIREMKECVQQRL
ncbi:MAG: GIY-YIG nuclease family protein [Snowella sp.]|nr:GIY-YIG nuclease family protein [Snowella sp.]